MSWTSANKTLEYLLENNIENEILQEALMYNSVGFLICNRLILELGLPCGTGAF